MRQDCQVALASDFVGEIMRLFLLWPALQPSAMRPRNDQPPQVGALIFLRYLSLIISKLRFFLCFDL